MTSATREGGQWSQGGVLSGKELRSRIFDRGDLVVTPILDPAEQVRESAIDLRLDKRFIVFARTQIPSFDPTTLRLRPHAIHEYQRRVKVGYGHEFVLHPNELVIGSSLEFVSLPWDIMAYVIGRSSWGRLGLVIATATAVNPRFRGTITLELVNVGSVPLILYPGTRIAQLIFHSVSRHGEETGASLVPAGAYQNQFGPAFSRIGKDPELPFLTPIRPALAVGLIGIRSELRARAVAYLRDERGFTLYSISALVRAEYSETFGPVRTPIELQAYATERRKAEGGAYWAHRLLYQMGEDRLPDNARVVILGISHPDEIEAFGKLSNFFTIGCNVEVKDCKDYLERNGFLDPAPALQADGNQSDASALQAQRLRRGLALRIEEFDAWFEGLMRGKTEFSPKLDACLPGCAVSLAQEDHPRDTLTKIENALRDHGMI